MVEIPHSASNFTNSHVRSGDIDDFSPLSADYLDDEVDGLYYPGDLYFANESAIPKRLMNEVITSYQDMQEYCKWCFYK